MQTLIRLTLAAVVFVACISLGAGPSARAAALVVADQNAKIVLKDGRVLDGVIVKELDGYIWIKVKIGGIEKEEFVKPDEIASIERDVATGLPAGDAATAGSSDPKETGKPKARTGGATRAAVLTLEGTVGMQMSAKPLDEAISMLEADGVDVVVLKINSGGGFLLEIQRLSDVIHNKYKGKFRTVAWIESAISAAAMTAHACPDIYFMPQGNYGACTGFSGRGNAVKGPELEQVLYMMEKISARGNYDPAIMRAMQIDSDDDTPTLLEIDPPSGKLSATIQPDGTVKWFDDHSGEHILNPKGGVKILTFNAQEAERFKFSLGTAATIGELGRLMGYNEIEWVGKNVKGTPWPVSRAEEHQLAWRENVGDSEARMNEYFGRFQMNVQAAAGEPDRTARGAFVNKAKNALAIIEGVVKDHPNIGLLLGIDKEWLDAQKELLKRLMQR